MKTRDYTKSFVLDRLRDRMRAVPDEIDTSQLPTRFKEAQATIAHTIMSLEEAGVPDSTLVAALVAELLPRLVHLHGPEWAAAVLARVAYSVGSGPPSNSRHQ